MLRRFWLALAVVAALGLPMSSAWAHVPSPVESVPVPVPAIETVATVLPAPLPSADMGAPIPWTLLGAVTLFGALCILSRRSRQVIALAVVSILVVFAFENGVHSVHHLDDAVGGASCAVASAATHVGGTPVDAGPTQLIELSPNERLASERQPGLEACSLAAHQGRAPPLAA